jgi:gliding motility-associated-like protein
LLLIIIFVFPHLLKAQIPTKVFEIESILVDGCAGSDEGRNEMVIFITGPNPVNINNIRVDGANSTGTIVTNVWPNTSNSFQGWETPGTMSLEVAQINATITNCGKLVEPPISGIIPAGKKCLIITSTEFDPTAHSFTSLGDTLYVFFQNAGNTSGHFVNFGTTSERTLVLTHTGGSGADTVRYDRANLINQSGVPAAQDGAGVRYTWSGISTYYNDGCQAPYTPISAAWTSPGNMCQSDAPIDLSTYITSGNGGTWSGSGVSGTMFDPAGLLGSITITHIAGTNPCADTVTGIINVNIVGDVTIDAAGPFCLSGSPVTLTADALGGSWSGTGITNASNGTFNPATAGIGSHQIIYTVPNCGGTDTAYIIVIASANTTITAAGPFCYLDASVTLSAASSGGYWDGLGITNHSNGTFDPIVAGAGTHTISYGIAGTCGDTSTIQITVNPQADATISAVAPLCSNASPIVMLATDAGGLWSGSGINTTSGAFDPSTAGNGNIEIIYTIAGACGDADTTLITVFETPVVNIFATGESCIDQNDGFAWIELSGGTLPYSVLWSNGETTDTISPLEPGIFSVLAEDQNGCGWNRQVVVAESDALCYTPIAWVPNIFSPNGDGQNDVLLVFGKGISTIEMRIFDRWGEKVFESNSIDNSWDGIYRGNKANAGVYVYELRVVFLDNSETMLSGNVTLVR